MRASDAVVSNHLQSDAKTCHIDVVAVNRSNPVQFNHTVQSTKKEKKKSTDKPLVPSYKGHLSASDAFAPGRPRAKNKTKMSKIALFDSRSPHLHTGHLLSLSNGTSLPMTIHPSFLGWSSHIFPIVEFPHPSAAPLLGGSPILLLPNINTQR